MPAAFPRLIAVFLSLTLPVDSAFSSALATPQVPRPSPTLLFTPQAINAPQRWFHQIIDDISSTLEATVTVPDRVRFGEGVMAMTGESQGSGKSQHLDFSRTKRMDQLPIDFHTAGLSPLRGRTHSSAADLNEAVQQKITAYLENARHKGFFGVLSVAMEVRTKDKRGKIKVPNGGGGQGVYMNEQPQAVQEEGIASAKFGVLFSEDVDNKFGSLEGYLEACSAQKVMDIEIPVGQGSYSLAVVYLEQEGVPVFQIYDPSGFLFRRLYASPHPDSIGGYLEAILLPLASIEVMRHLGIEFEAYHFNDWQTAMGPAFLHEFYREYAWPLGHRPAALFTVHNLEYQGRFPGWKSFDMNNDADIAMRVHLAQRNIVSAQGDVDLFRLTGMNPSLRDNRDHGAEFWSNLVAGQHNLFKLGVLYSQRVVFVSKGHAKESLSTSRGYGQDGLLRRLQDRLRAVYNGIHAQWHRPENLAALEESGTNAKTGLQYQFVKPPRKSTSMTKEEILQWKKTNGRALQMKLGLEVSDKSLILGFATRIVKQKGLNILATRLEDGKTLLEKLLELKVNDGGNLQIVILGKPDDPIGDQQVAFLAQFVRDHPEYASQLSVVIDFDPALAKQIGAAAPVGGMFSIDEPGGLANQELALLYCLILATARGGLVDFKENNGTPLDLIEGFENDDSSGRRHDESDAEVHQKQVQRQRSARQILVEMERLLAMWVNQPGTFAELLATLKKFKPDWGYRAGAYVDIYLEALEQVSPGFTARTALDRLENRREPPKAEEFLESHKTSEFINGSDPAALSAMIRRIRSDKLRFYDRHVRAAGSGAILYGVYAALAGARDVEIFVKDAHAAELVDRLARNWGVTERVTAYVRNFIQEPIDDLVPCEIVLAIPPSQFRDADEQNLWFKVYAEKLLGQGLVPSAYSFGWTYALPTSQFEEILVGVRYTAETSLRDFLDKFQAKPVMIESRPKNATQFVAMGGLWVLFGGLMALIPAGYFWAFLVLAAAFLTYAKFWNPKLWAFLGDLTPGMMLKMPEDQVPVPIAPKVSEFMNFLVDPPAAKAETYFADLADKLSQMSADELVAVFHAMAWVADSPFVGEFFISVLKGKTTDQKSLRNRLLWAIQRDSSHVLFWVFVEVAESIEAATINEVIQNAMTEARYNSTLSSEINYLFLALLFGTHECERRTIRSTNDTRTIEGKKVLVDHYMREWQVYSQYRESAVLARHRSHLAKMAFLEYFNSAILQIRTKYSNATWEQIDREFRASGMDTVAHEAEMKSLDASFDEELTGPEKPPLIAYIRLKARIQIRAAHADYLLVKDPALAQKYVAKTKKLQDELNDMREEQRRKIFGQNKQTKTPKYKLFWPLLLPPGLVALIPAGYFWAFLVLAAAFLTYAKFWNPKLWAFLETNMPIPGGMMARLPEKPLPRRVQVLRPGLSVEKVWVVREVDGVLRRMQGEVWRVDLRRFNAVQAWADNYRTRDLEARFHEPNDPDIGKTIEEYVRSGENPEAVALAVNSTHEHFIMNNTLLIHDGQWVMAPPGRRDLYQAYQRRQAREKQEPLPEFQPPHGTFWVLSLDPDKPGLYKVEVDKNGRPIGEPPVREGFAGPLIKRQGFRQISQLRFEKKPQYAGNDLNWGPGKRQAFSAFGYGPVPGELIIVQLYGAGASPHKADPTLIEVLQVLETQGVQDAILGGTSADVQRYAADLNPSFVWTHPRVGSLLEKTFGTERGRRVGTVLKLIQRYPSIQTEQVSETQPDDSPKIKLRQMRENYEKHLMEIMQELRKSAANPYIPRTKDEPLSAVEFATMLASIVAGQILNLASRYPHDQLGITSAELRYFQVAAQVDFSHGSDIVNASERVRLWVATVFIPGEDTNSLHKRLDWAAKRELIPRPLGLHEMVRQLQEAIFLVAQRGRVDVNLVREWVQRTFLLHTSTFLNATGATIPIKLSSRDDDQYSKIFLSGTLAPELLLTAYAHEVTHVVLNDISSAYLHETLNSQSTSRVDWITTAVQMIASRRFGWEKELRKFDPSVEAVGLVPWQHAVFEIVAAHPLPNGFVDQCRIIDRVVDEQMFKLAEDLRTHGKQLSPEQTNAFRIYLEGAALGGLAISWAKTQLDETQQQNLPLLTDKAGEFVRFFAETGVPRSLQASLRSVEERLASLAANGSQHQPQEPDPKHVWQVGDIAQNRQGQEVVVSEVGSGGEMLRVNGESAWERASRFEFVRRAAAPGSQWSWPLPPKLAALVPGVYFWPLLVVAAAFLIYARWWKPRQFLKSLPTSLETKKWLKTHRMEAGFHTVTAGRGYEKLWNQPARRPQLAELAEEALANDIMPGVDQISVLKALRKKTSLRKKPIAFLLGNRVELAEEAARAGANVLIGEGFTPEILKRLRSRFPQVVVIAEVGHQINGINKMPRDIEVEISALTDEGIDGLLLKPFAEWDRRFRNTTLSASSLQTQFPGLLVFGAGGVFENRAARVLQEHPRMVAAVGVNAMSLPEFKSQISRYAAARTAVQLALGEIHPAQVSGDLEFSVSEENTYDEQDMFLKRVIRRVEAQSATHTVLLRSPIEPGRPLRIAIQNRLLYAGTRPMMEFLEDFHRLQRQAVTLNPEGNIQPYFRMIDEGNSIKHSVPLSELPGDVLEYELNPSIAGKPGRGRPSPDCVLCQDVVVKTIRNELIWKWGGLNIYFNPYPIWPPKADLNSQDHRYHLVVSWGMEHLSQEALSEESVLKSLREFMMALNADRQTRGLAPMTMMLNGWNHGNTAVHGGASQNHVHAHMVARRFASAGEDFDFVRSWSSNNPAGVRVAVRELLPGQNSRESQGAIVMHAIPPSAAMLDLFLSQFLKAIQRMGHSFNVVYEVLPEGFLKVSLIGRLLGVPRESPNARGTPELLLRFTPILSKPERYLNFEEGLLEELQTIPPAGMTSWIQGHLNEGRIHWKSDAQLIARYMDELNQLVYTLDQTIRLFEQFFEISPNQLAPADLASAA